MINKSYEDAVNNTINDHSLEDAATSSYEDAAHTTMIKKSYEDAVNNKINDHSLEDAATSQL